eukprot:PLAT4207.1.p1 GENE.PLAT4207.1~~PLAT4207.1.p1  ORF type:complete len:316 (-),score=158.98 PLAT4207.1:74-1021(-)
MSKRHIQAGRAASGERVQENPLIELETMQYLSDPGHPNVLRLLACVEDEDNLYGVLEFCSGGELFDLAQEGRFSEEQARQFFVQCMRGVKYIHDSGICHRDLSLENLLLADGDAIKVIDFGLCKNIVYDDAGVRALLPPTGACGKFFYMAPEIYENRRPYDPVAADVWSCGIILFIMLTGAPAFERPDWSDDRFRFIAGGNLAELLRMWGMADWFSPEALDMLVQLVCVDAAGRPSVEDILLHPWLVDLLTEEEVAVLSPDKAAGGGGEGDGEAAGGGGYVEGGEAEAIGAADVDAMLLAEDELAAADMDGLIGL